MSSLEEKITEQFKDGDWELKTVEEIATDIYGGTEVTKSQLGTGDYPAIKAGDVNTGLPMHFYKCISFVDPKLLKNKRFFECGDVLISDLSSKLETLGRAIVYLGNEKCLSGNDVVVIKHKHNAKFLSFALSTNFCKQQILRCATRGTVCHLYITNIKQLQIPVPKLETQNAITEVLNRFIELSSEIDAEIESTNKQYEFYKELIFS